MEILTIFEILIILIAIIFGISVSEKFLGRRSKSYTYKRKDFLMSRPEHEFFDILMDVLEGQCYVFPQIHLPNILNNKIVGQNWRGSFRHIDEKSVDFVICDKKYIKPLLAIELDDRTHSQNNRKDRDKEVERILSEANMPLLRFGNNGHFNKEEIKRLVLEKLK